MKKVFTRIAAVLTLAVMLFTTTACAKEIIYVADLTNGTYTSQSAGNGGQGGTQTPDTSTSEYTPSQSSAQTPSSQSAQEGGSGGAQTIDDGNGDGTTYALRVWCAEEDYDMIYEMLDAYAQKYSANTYKWTVEKQGEDTVSAAVIRDVSAAADVFSFANDQIGTLNNNQALTKIPAQYIEQIENQIDVAKVAAMVGEDYYAIPYSYENCFLYYNKSKITNVSSLEGILNTTIPGVEYNLGIDMSDSYYTTMFMYTAGVEIFGAQGNDPTSIDLDNAKAYKACQYIYDLGSKSKLGSIAKAEQYSSLKNGLVAAMISGPHMISQFKDALGSNFGVAMLPTIKFAGESTATQMTSFSGVKLYGVSRKTADVRDAKTTAEALKLASYLANADNQQIRLEVREFCPTDAELFEEAEASGIKTVEVVVAQSGYSKLKPGIIEMSNYWDNMKNFLLGVYKMTYGTQAEWSAELKKVEAKLRG